MYIFFKKLYKVPLFVNKGNLNTACVNLEKFVWMVAQQWTLSSN